MLRSAASGSPEGGEGDLSIEGTITCDGCGAVQPESTPVCEECGYELPAAVGGEGDEDWLRHSANRELKQAYKRINAVALLYRFGAVGYGLAALLAVAALARPEVPRTGGVVVVVLTTALGALMLMGAIQILFHPFAWTVAIAAMATVAALVHLVGPNPFGLAFLVAGVLAVLAWSAVLPTFRFHQLIEAHKDRYILHHASARTRRSLHNRTPAQRHRRLLGAMHRAAMRAWKISAVGAGILVLASALGTSHVLEHVRPQVLSDAVAEFESAWNASSLVGVRKAFDERVRTAYSRRLQGRLAGHGWEGHWPPIADGERREGGDRTWVDYDLAGMPMSVAWHREGQRWTVLDVKLPVPPFEPTLDRFLAAWGASDVRQLSSFFTDDSRQRMYDSIRAAAEKRGWNPFPTIVDTKVDDPSNGDVDADLKLLDEKVVKTGWSLREDGTWKLHRLELPKWVRTR